MPLNETSGNLTTDAFGGGVAVVPAYIEDVFSTWLYSGNSSTQSIVNNIDLSTKGGMVWTKSRNAAYDNTVYDTVRGTGSTKAIYTDDTSEQGAFPSFQDLTAYNTNGYSIGSPILLNETGTNYASWTFRKQPKWFDIQTWTGTGSNRTISHNLGSVPGCIMVKRTDTTGDWQVYHRSLANTEYLVLNTTAAKATGATRWNSTTPTSAVFSVGTDASVNASGGTYVAYLFAHDAGGFGLTSTDNVISCGSFTASGGIASVTLGYEPQWLLIKRSNGVDDWQLFDTMRGMTTQPTYAALLRANTAGTEATGGASGAYVTPTATGFDFNYGSTAAYIYIAIRRGPMKVPTDATKVFAPVTGNFSSPYTVTTNFPVDLTISARTAGATRAVNDRLRGGTTNSYAYLNTISTAAESTGTGAGLGFDNNTGVVDVNWQTGGNAIWWNFQRAPSSMDVVCWTGDGTTGRLITHNLTVKPQMVITKCRSTTGGWYAYVNASGTTAYVSGNGSPNQFGFNKTNDAYGATSSPYLNAITSTTFATDYCTYTDATGNASGATYVAYLFATCAGVSKVGSYTGTGATQTINCGFTGGARFVLIKRTDSTGDWWVWDSARGMVSGTDYRIDLNAGNPQTNANWVYTATTGFQIVTTDASVNASGGTYIFLAIA